MSSTRPGKARPGPTAVANPALPLKVTLAWTDAPGPVGPSAGAYVNNLDLVVEAGGRTYKGNVFGTNTGLSVAGGTADAKNNVESVSLPGGTRGLFRVRVVGANVPGDGLPGNPDLQDQDFALVVSNARPEPNSPVLVHERSVVSDQADGDGDGTLEPAETFTLDETVRNAGDGTAAGPISGVLSGDPGLTVRPQPPARWNEILPGATQPSSPDPVAQISAATICGQDVTGTLALTTGVETQDIPLTMTTGSAQPATANTITHPPALTLPDNSAAGVTSTINVTRPGRIKDLDVRIGAILYPWIGDLRVDVVGPDGTTVTLADHPGGPDNRGDNMVGTVFDDEATTNIAAGRAPYSGRFKPQRDQLSRFDGKQRQGAWKLRVRDLVAGDNGSLVSWGTEMSARRATEDPTRRSPRGRRAPAPRGPHVRPRKGRRRDRRGLRVPAGRRLVRRMRLGEGLRGSRRRRPHLPGPALDASGNVDATARPLLLLRLRAGDLDPVRARQPPNERSFPVHLRTAAPAPASSAASTAASRRLRLRPDVFRAERGHPHLRRPGGGFDRQRRRVARRADLDRAGRPDSPRQQPRSCTAARDARQPCGHHRTQLRARPRQRTAGPMRAQADCASLAGCASACRVERQAHPVAPHRPSARDQAHPGQRQAQPTRRGSVRFRSACQPARTGPPRAGDEAEGPRPSACPAGSSTTALKPTISLRSAGGLRI